MPDYYRIKLFTKKFDNKKEQDEEIKRRNYCFDKNLFAIGWSVEGEIENIEKYKELAKDKYCPGKELSKNNIYSSLQNMEKMKKGDFVWTQKDGRTYYLGKVDSDNILFKEDYIKTLGLTRSCEKWKEIDFNDVPGVVTSYFAGPGKVLVNCKNINECEEIKDYCNWLYDGKQKKITIKDYEKLLHYDDLEDLLGLYLQGGGHDGKRYYIHPSTNKLSTKLIEYELRGEDGEKVGIQCKIGKSTVNSNNLQELTQKGYTIFVSTISNSPCVGKNIENISVDELWNWAKDNPKILPDRIKNYILLCPSN